MYVMITDSGLLRRTHLQVGDIMVWAPCTNRIWFRRPKIHKGHRGHPHGPLRFKVDWRDDTEPVRVLAISTRRTANLDQLCADLMSTHSLDIKRGTFLDWQEQPGGVKGVALGRRFFVCEFATQSQRE